MSKKSRSLLSGFCFVIAVLPLLAGLTKWGNSLYTGVLEISVFLPLLFASAGLLFALIGAGGRLKGILVSLNAAGVSLAAFLVFIALFGFQQP
ncbi:hypothetical protein SLL00_11460 [Metabacillus indicus]|uniref:hypothetical protein n=1 Tax=Metabacillus TaxID=2675233 RepID=UPI00193AB07C|nr:MULTISPECIES: hypothetical protein [Metabacillus]MDX8290416.1 hypothetical protein [Metabacillus indicus]